MEIIKLKIFYNCIVKPLFSSCYLAKQEGNKRISLFQANVSLFNLDVHGAILIKAIVCIEKIQGILKD